jgi:hypothetical protein
LDIFDDGDCGAKDEGGGVEGGLRVVVALVLGDAAGDVHRPVVEDVDKFWSREKPGSAQAGALQHGLGKAREGVVVALAAADALMVLARRELHE